MAMTKLDRYLLSEMILPFISGVLLIIVMLVGNTIWPLIEMIVKSNIPLGAVTKLVAYNIPMLVPLTLPAATALGAAFAVNRLARDSEVTAIRMAGVPVRRLFLPIFIVGLVVSLVSFYIFDSVAPRAQHEFEQTQNQMAAYAIQAAPEVAQDRVFTYNDYSFHIRLIQRVSAKDPNRLQLTGVTIFHNTYYGDFPEIITAQSAVYDHEIWTLNNAIVHTLGPDGFTATEISAKRIVLNLRVPMTGLAESAFTRPDELTMAQLGTQMRALQKTGQDSSEVAFNYYSKLALPFVCLAFAICAPPLSLRFARAGAYMGIFLSLILVWVGWNTLLLTKFLGVSGKVNPEMAAWFPDVLFLVAGLYFLWRVE